MKDVSAADRIKLRTHLEADFPTVSELAYLNTLAPTTEPAEPVPTAPPDPEAEPSWWDPPAVVASRQAALLTSRPSPVPPDEA